MKDLARLPSLNGLRAFEVAARHLNFRLAAEELGVTQGAVAQQVRNLEAQLGLQLFHRQSRSLFLTEAGRGYVTNIRKAFDLIAEATRVLRPEPAHLTISVAPTFAAKWLIPRLPDFTDAHPDIDLRIVASDRISNFQTDAVDLAVRLGRPPFGPGLVAEHLFDQVVIAVASPAALQRLGPASAPCDLLGLALLHDAHDLWPQALDLIFPDGAPAPAKNIRFNQTSLAIEAAMAGQGIALTPQFYVSQDLAAGKLVACFDLELRTGADFYVVAPRKVRNVPHVTAVRDWLRVQARRI
ncbi:transcriptional regulator GcvA [Tabrizicola oligotrophica]|uniref:Transcriptional regulator GcvA n=1 Tax=Tabrizicola oligotrophica TaxID=2710650 RepID=A0A6M0QYW4_9RHOB|nr:transcriptional regulator GcvA [Tabrizicola oligotrophica]NEY92221.1 transcriptional regulator GcvA [Tabrizicola oligotrophica]